MCRPARTAAASVFIACLTSASPPTAAAADDGRAAEAGAIRARVDRLLLDEMTKRWYPRALDREKGGFHQNYARDWSYRPDEDRFAVYQARLTWTAAAYARHDPSRRDEFLGYARHGVDFLDTAMRDGPDGGFHFVAASRGGVDPALGGEKHVYGTAFVLYAASEAVAAGCGGPAPAVARDAFAWLETHAHDPEHGGYREALSRDGTPIPAPPDGAPTAGHTDRLGVPHGYKTMNSHIHLLEAVAAFHKVDPTPLSKRRLAELLAVVRDKIAVGPGALNLYMTRDWRALPAHDSFGHDVETAYLLIEAAEALGLHDDPATSAVARRLVDHALEFGWDDEFGGFYDKGEVFGPAYDRTKVWWTQAEGLNALLLMHRRHGRETDRYWRAFKTQWSFIERHQLDPEFGGFFGEVTREGALIGDGHKASQWQADYHTGRALMNASVMLGEVIGEAKPAH